MTTVGYYSEEEAKEHLGYWRQIYLLSMVRAFVEQYQPHLSMKQYFHHLEASEKGFITFSLAQGLAQCFAQHHMNLTLIHLSRKYFVVEKNKTRPIRAKWNLTPPRRNSYPDFVGVDLRHGSIFKDLHVFEVKGRTRSNALDKAVEKALRQVSNVGTVNGVSPLTRTATCFGFNGTPIHGIIMDPPEAKPYDLHFKVASSLLATYALFFDLETDKVPFRPVPNLGMHGLDFKRYVIPGIGCYAIDENVLEKIKGVKNMLDEHKGKEENDDHPTSNGDIRLKINEIREENERLQKPVLSFFDHLSSKQPTYEEIQRESSFSINNNGIAFKWEGA